MSESEIPYSTARGYVQSAYTMMISPVRFSLPDDTPYHLSFHMLCGFAVELYLKSYLVEQGITDNQLMRPPFGHDLKSLYEECSVRKFKNSGALALIEYFGDYHKQLIFRHAKRDVDYPVPNIRAMFTAFSKLDSYIDKVTNARASRGLPPEQGWNFPLEASVWRVPH